MSDRQLPLRYRRPWRDPFDGAIRRLMRPGMAILDVGSGRRPTVPTDARAEGVLYVGLDVSAAELEAAPPGSYDEVWAADVSRRIPELEGRFDLVVSWQVLEHVRPLDEALENIRRYLRPGGVLVAHLSGRNSVFAIGNLLIPHRLAVLFVTRVLGRPRTMVFPAHYHLCWHRALTLALGRWASRAVVPRYHGAEYLAFLPPVQRLYLRYEDWALHTRRRNLGTYYLIIARR
jgi:SAM-dependent methyltransferase